jgi:hypothetical protein
MQRASEEYPLALMASIVISALLCLIGSVEYYRFESAYQEQNRDPYLISAQFVRFEPLLSSVSQRAELGYLTDAQPGSVTDSAMFLGAQYVLAPRLLAKGAANEWVLGNFSRPADFAAVGRSNGLRLQQDFGNGVVLFRRDH